MVVEWLWRSVICPFTLRCHKFILTPDLQIKALPQSLCHPLTPDCDWLLSLKTWDSLHPRQSQVLPWRGSNVWKTHARKGFYWMTGQQKLSNFAINRSTERRQRKTTLRFSQLHLTEGLDWLDTWSGNHGASFSRMCAWTPHAVLGCCSKWNVLLVFVLNRMMVKEY